MRLLLVEISGESPPLAAAEAVAAAETLGGGAGPSRPEFGDQVISIQLPDGRTGEELAERLGLARRCLETRSEGDTLGPTLERYARAGDSVSVRRLGRPSSGGEDPRILALGRAYVSAGGRIDLGDPAHRLWLIGPPNGPDAVLEEVAAIDRPAASARRMPTLPFQRPVALAPRLARAAANLARVGPGRRVLDPFVGTGALLAEAGLLGGQLFGIDREAAMVRGALRNLQHLGVTANELVVGDAGEVDVPSAPPTFDAILTDPPYGRASSTGGEVASEVVDRVLPRWAARVGPNGRIVVITPGPPVALGPEWEERLHVAVRVHRSLTRNFRVYERAGLTTTSPRTSS